MTRSHSGQHRKVEQARAVVAQALGDAARRDGPQVSKFVPTTLTEPIRVKDESVLVLAIGEVATRLDISRTEVERMVATGTVKSVVAGWTTMVLASEVERLRRGGA